MLKSFFISAGPKSCSLDMIRGLIHSSSSAFLYCFSTELTLWQWRLQCFTVLTLHSLLLSDVHSLPSEVCTVVSDADCITPVETVCNTVAPAPECQLILRQFFNDTGVFCINVSLTNDVSLAVASARVSVTVGESGDSRLELETLGAILIPESIILDSCDFIHEWSGMDISFHFNMLLFFLLLLHCYSTL